VQMGRAVPTRHIIWPLVQVFTQHAPALHAPLVQGDVADSYTQFCASAEHVASVIGSAHAVPTAAQTGSTLQAQLADPAGPAQVCRAPQGKGAPKPQQPLLPRVHVSRPPVAHIAWPRWHALVQQAPALQLAHVEVADATTQPCASVEHVTSVVELVHVAPAAPQVGSALQEHAAEPGAPVQL
jgi:hypothetical protein